MSAYAGVLLGLILIFSLYMGYNNGAVAVAPTVATRAMNFRVAVLVAAFFKFIIPVIEYFIGATAVAGNISAKLINNSVFAGVSQEKAFAFVLASMGGTLLWSLIVEIFKFPSSTSHTLFGGLIGASVVAFGLNSVQWMSYVLISVIAYGFLSPVIGLVFGYIFMKLFKYMARRASRGMSAILRAIQKINLVLLAGTFSSNNSQKSLGVFMMMVTLGLVDYSSLAPHADLYIVLAVAGALTIGMLMGGAKIINNVGRKIFRMEDVHSVVAQLTTNIVMLGVTQLGVSVSTSQVLVSSIMGTGAAERASGVRWSMAGRILTSWFVTLPVAAIIGGALYWIMALIMGIP